MAGENVDRWFARIVIGAVLTALLGTAVLQQEAWPLSSYRLFSEERDREQTARELVAVYEKGSTVPVRFGGNEPVLATTAHLLDDLKGESTSTKRRMAEAWLDMSEVDAQRVSAVRVDVVTRRFTAEGRWTTTSRTTEARVQM